MLHRSTPPALTNLPSVQTDDNVRHVNDVVPVLQALNNSTGSVLLQTAFVDVSSKRNVQRTRAILDPGAAMSLITSRLAYTLKNHKTEKQHLYWWTWW